ncbi:hypothetical protein [Deinococcus fonticola]|uniref:hypothetical protein n=1 Tax=Deinococcus fonticola TaxID=2528713 RepID=UPI001074F640|nr:hypothetical protein [Deinococcus fonticola]
MKGRLSLYLLPLLLVACQGKDVLAPEQYDLSGTLHGDWGTNPSLRLALVGTGIPNVFTNDSTYAQNVVKVNDTTRRFGLDLPRLPNLAGVYQAIAFDDRNNNAKYDVGEPVARNRLWLIYSPTDATTPAVNLPEQFPWAAGEEAIPELNVKSGWNVYNRAEKISPTNPSPAGKITGYDIYR